MSVQYRKQVTRRLVLPNHRKNRSKKFIWMLSGMMMMTIFLCRLQNQTNKNNNNQDICLKSSDSYFVFFMILLIFLSYYMTHFWTEYVFFSCLYVVSDVELSCSSNRHNLIIFLLQKASFDFWYSTGMALFGRVDVLYNNIFANITIKNIYCIKKRKMFVNKRYTEENLYLNLLPKSLSD